MPVPTPVSVPAVITPDRPLHEPLSQLLRAYDRAIDACEAFDRPRAQAAIGLLRSALDLESAASRSFDALYAWCDSSVERHDFVGAAQCLRTLRTAWRRALHPEPAPIRPRRDRPVC